jgi:hypothetical protein
MPANSKQTQNKISPDSGIHIEHGVEMGSTTVLRRLAIQTLILITALGLAGCTNNWHAAHREYTEPYEHGDFTLASDKVTSIADHGVDTDKVLLRLEEGAILRTAGHLPESNTAFDQADQLVGDYQQWPTVRISEEALAALTTARSINYRGELSDLVMLNTYRALNYLELGNPDGARPMLIRAAFVQQDIADKYAKELQKAQDDINKNKEDNKSTVDTDQTVQNKDPQGRTIQQQVESDDKDLLNLQSYANYVNPFCDYLQGLFFMAYAGDSSDLERAVTAFKRTASMVKNNPYLAQDIADANLRADGRKVAPATYVIFETGMAPARGQIQIPLPLFLVNRQAPTVTLYFPTLHSRRDYVSALWAAGGGKTARTELLCNMDAVVVQEFNNELPQMITRMIIAAATKAAIDEGGKEALKGQSAVAQLAFNVTSAVYQFEMNQADLRIWQTLPKQFQLARLPTPADGNLTLSGPGVESVSVNVTPGKVNIVYVKSVRPGVPLVVRQETAYPPGQGPAKIAAISKPDVTN